MVKQARVVKEKCGFYLSHTRQIATVLVMRCTLMLKISMREMTLAKCVLVKRTMWCDNGIWWKNVSTRTFIASQFEWMWTWVPWFYRCSDKEKMFNIISVDHRASFFKEWKIRTSGFIKLFFNSAGCFTKVSMPKLHFINLFCNSLSFYSDTVTRALCHHSFSNFSDQKQHDTTAVYVFQEKVLNYIKLNLPFLKCMTNFSDYCVEPCKNFKFFLKI